MEFINFLGQYIFTFILHICGNGKFPKPLSEEKEKEYLLKSKNGDIKARNILVEHNLRLVAHIIKKYYAVNVDQDDLVSIGTIGLIKAINTFDMDKNIKLSSYASRCIENEILMHFRNLKKSSQNVSLEDAVDIDKDGNTLKLMDLLSIDDDFEIICEPLIVDGDVVEYISDVVFIHGDCNMSYLTTNWTDEPDVVAFEMDWEYEDDDDCYDEECDCEDCEYYDECFGCDENEEDFDDNGLYLAVNNDTDEVVGFKYVFEDEYGTSEYTYFADDPDDVRDALNRFMRGLQ